MLERYMLFMLKLRVAELQKKPNALNSMLLQLAVLRNYFFFGSWGKERERRCEAHNRLHMAQKTQTGGKYCRISHPWQGLPSLDFLICKRKHKGKKNCSLPSVLPSNNFQAITELRGVEHS